MRPETKSETGTFVRRAQPQHACYPPNTMGDHDDWYFTDDAHEMSAPKLKWGVRLPAVGDVWQCPCGQTWVLRPAQSGYGFYSAPDWSRETKRERRRRERGPWWAFWRTPTLNAEGEDDE